MKGFIIILLIVACLLYAGSLTIGFSPFSIQFKTWKVMLAMIFIGLGFNFFLSHGEDIGRKKVWDKIELAIKNRRSELERRINKEKQPECEKLVKKK